MESSKNGRWIIPFKKFGMVRVNYISGLSCAFRRKIPSPFVQHLRDVIIHFFAPVRYPCFIFTYAR